MSIDKYYLLYQDDNGVRHIAEVKLSDKSGRIDPIGLSRYTEFEDGSTVADFNRVGGTELSNNGSYPLLKSDIFNSLYGKVMQICDAMIADKDQKNAFKGLLKDELSQWFDKNLGYTFRMTEEALKAIEKTQE